MVPKNMDMELGQLSCCATGVLHVASAHMESVLRGTTCLPLTPELYFLHYSAIFQCRWTKCQYLKYILFSTFTSSPTQFIQLKCTIFQTQTQMQEFQELGVCYMYVCVYACTMYRTLIKRDDGKQLLTL